MPQALARSIWAKPSVSLFCSPQVMLPRHRALTWNRCGPVGRIFHVLLLGSTAKAKHKAGCYFCNNRHNSAAFSAGMPSPCEKEGGDA